ncbi:predicted protein [Naegleria gruberi]|uniref:Predicted protein n=1 Tax=Naegleria gruberi TaxID=5762 RepID=D2VR01_NAEGR|nr:uncharacterized protein NAEGRDRAFT_71408 [Naegleria gruberi]EFC40724.1 predicted protein [Naegleria gruberi]|eukprot:XP_002673468.1 predicted protein [Naegleria gruberi strain NEG-M]
MLQQTEETIDEKLRSNTTTNWKDIPLEVWTHHIWSFLHLPELFSIRLVSHEWNDFLLHHARDYLLHVKLNRIHMPSFLICCKHLYFNNIGKLDMKFIEYALEPKHQKPLDETERKEIAESFNPLEYFPNLSSLKLTLTDVKSLETVSPQIANMKYLNDLDIRSNLMTNKCLNTILTQPVTLMSLTRLDVSVNVLGTSCVEFINSNPHLSNLKYLNMSNNQLLLFHTKVESVFKDTLEELYVSDCSLNIESMKNILVSYPKLTTLDFSFNKLEKIKNLYQSIQLENDTEKYCKLIRLNMSGSKLRNDQLEYIAKIPIFSELRILDLSRNRINKLGTEKLADESISVLSKVEYLDLSRCGIGKEGAQNIRQSSIFSSLKLLIE